MDRVSRLADDLSAVLDELHRQAADDNVRSLMAPLAWLDEANGWLRYELARLPESPRDDPVPFTYIPQSLRR